MLGDKPLRRGGRAKRIVGKLNVGLVDHDHAGARIAQGRDKVSGATSPVGLLGEVTMARLHSGAAASTAAWSSLKVAGSRHTSRTSVWHRDAKKAYSLKHRRAVEQGPPRAAKRQQVVIE